MAKPPTVDYKDIMESDGIAEWTRQIVCGFYDFTSNMASKDTAYTSLALEAHTDTTYFSEPAGLQMFHMLSHTGGSGGESLLVDGFAAARQLYGEDKEAYKILSTVGIWAHASGNEDVSIQPYVCFPVLSHDPVLGHLVQVRWNNADRAAIEAPSDKIDAWYEAARKFNRILNDPQNQYWTQLEPGMPLIFDNWRVLHGRGVFTGKRRMAGGYNSSRISVPSPYASVPFISHTSQSTAATMSTLEDLDALEHQDKKEGEDQDPKKPNQTGDADMKDADADKQEEQEEEEEEQLDADILNSSTRDIVTRRRLLENDTRIMRSEFQRLTHEKQSMLEKIKDNVDKIDNNRQLPYLVGNVVEILDLDVEEDAAEEGANVDLDATRVGKSAVIKTSTRQTIFLPLIGLVDHEKLKPGDLIGVN
ncbi:Trimethyllysine dioxygenase, partial [Aureobasidium sp. EXF-8845]